MRAEEFYKELSKVPDAFFWWNNKLRTREREGFPSVEPFVALMRASDIEYNNIGDAVKELNLSAQFLLKIMKWSDGEVPVRAEEYKEYKKFCRACKVSPLR